MFMPPADTYGRGRSYEERVCFPLEHGLDERLVLQTADRRSARQSDRQPGNTVKVYVVLIAMIPKPVDCPVPTGLASANSSINEMPPLVRQMASDDNLSIEEAVVTDLDFCDSVVGGPTSTFLKNTGLIVDLAGGVTVGVSSPADLDGDVTIGVSSPADLAGDIAVAVTSPTDLNKNITIGVVLSAVAEVASSADIAEVASSADLAEVASSADLDLTGDVTVGVMSSAVAEAASLADLAEVASSADLAGDFTVGVTSLAGPASVVTGGVAFQEECEIPSGSVRDYDDYFYDASLMTINRTISTMMIRVILIVTLVCMALLGEIIMSCILICMGHNDCGVYCVSRGDVGVVPYWSEDEEGDVYEGDVALHRAGSDKPVDGLGYCVISTFGPGGPYDEEGDVSEGDVSMHRTGVIGSDVPWLECPACNALTWVITVTE